MKRVKFLSAFIIPIACSMLIGCNQSNKDLDDSSVLNICLPDLGYGTDWLYSMADGFTEKTGHRVNIEVTTTESGYVTSIRAGKAKHDIYILREQTYSLVMNNQSNYSGYDPVLASYDDIYNSTIPGEDITFKDKMKDAYEQYNRLDVKGNGDNHYYAVQWCDSLQGIVMNLDVWDAHHWSVPNTTDELIALSQQIKNEGGYPFIWCSQDSYWWNLANIWVTQYEGMESMFGDKGFWKGYDADGNQNVPELWLRDGLHYALQTLDTIVKDENGFQHPYSESVDFTTAQGYFLIPNYNIAMMVNGDWLYKEMSKNYSSARIEMMKAPVISNIIDHPDCENTIADDAELSALIKAIDAGSTSLTGTGYDVSQKAYDKVASARHTYTCGANANHIMISPAYSDSLDIVKEFMLYYASNEGINKFITGSGGFLPPFEISEEMHQVVDTVANDFVKSCEKIKRGSEVAPWPVYYSLLFTMGGLSAYPTIETGYSRPELIFSQSGDAYMSGDQLFFTNYNNAKSHWSEYLRKAGLI